MTLITCARPSLPRAHSPSFLTTRHARSNTRSTSIFMPSVISWNAASQSSNSSDASRPASKKPPEITWPSSPSLPLSYGYGKCPHYLGHRPPGRHFLHVFIAETFQPDQSYGRQERQALDEQDCRKQIRLCMTVDIGGIDRGCAGDQQ